MKTISAKLCAPWQVRFDEVELPEPVAGQALLRIEACSVCGTDLTGATTSAKWHPFGHEVAAVIESLAPDVKHLKAGQRVVLESSSFCGHCETCRSGRVDLCNKAPNFWGQPAMGFSRHMIAPACCLVPYEGLTPEMASIVEPAGVAYDMVRTARIELGDHVAVVGPGPIGLVAAAMALRGGAASVTVIGHSHSKRRLEIAKQLGAKTVACDGKLADEKDLAKRFEHVLVTSPTDTLVDGLSLLAYGGEMTYVGIGVGSGMIQFDANEFHFRKLQLRASYASPAVYYPQVLRLLTAGIVPKEIISHCFPLERLGDALALARDNKADVVKVVVKP